MQLSPVPSSFLGRERNSLVGGWVGGQGHDRDQSQNVQGLHVFDTGGGRGIVSGRIGFLSRGLQYGLTYGAIRSLLL